MLRGVFLFGIMWSALCLLLLMGTLVVAMRLPPGSQLAYVLHENGPDAASGDVVYLADVRTGAQVPVFSAEEIGLKLQWAGESLYMIQRIGEEHRLVQVHIPSGEVASLAAVRSYRSNMAVSPDGQWLAYEDGRGVITLRHLRDGHIQGLYHPSSAYVVDIHWSQDSGALYVRRLVSRDMELMRVALATGMAEPVMVVTANEWVTDGSTTVMVAWQPETGNDLVRAPLDDPAGQTALTSDAADDHMPLLSPDGETVGFIRCVRPGMACGLSVMKTAGGGLRPVLPGRYLSQRQAVETFAWYIAVPAS
ncbi:MAG: hypothetical protein OHK0046_11950 [Anaerolineae bacterium]